jgi:hypothetical protein
MLLHSVQMSDGMQDRMVALMNLLRRNDSIGEDIATIALQLISDVQHVGDARSAFDLTTLCMEAVPDPEADLHKVALQARSKLRANSHPCHDAHIY